ncbi:hypothetical protein HY68_05450 [Streptomyces sp. AcH 505]|uniref:pilus assembly protein TadG-related protein n=1 Tax=Streptomyces sp. AcH 505 TaxID=352211 RepID=UPI0005922F3C|nr:hypothetical protein HY68_05450 [Streptomyces sp. AcH 505]
MTTYRRGDQGQAFPIYIVMVAGLLFLALAFFAVGKAAATRNGAQGAADAAALAAAQDARELLGPDFLAALLKPDELGDIFDGQNVLEAHPCFEAQVFAEKNRSRLVPPTCVLNAGLLRDEFTVHVETLYTVGDSVIPGTEGKHATATATAVLEPRCTWKQEDEQEEDPTGDPAADPDAPPAPVSFACDGGDLTIDPANPGSWGELSEKLFAVHLVDGS